MSRSAKIMLAFATVCLAWGASYFSIRIGLKAMPPLLLGGVRYGIAGTLLWGWCELRGDEKLSRRQWMTAALLGVCFVVIGNGTVLWAEQTVPSGVTALLVAVTPVGTLMMEWAMRIRTRPSALTWLGLGLGLTGVAILVGHVGATSFPVTSALVVLLGTLGWSLGSTLTLKLDRPLSPIRAISSQMIVGSLVLFTLGAVSREDRQFHLSNVALPSIAALFYLIFIASVAAYIAYGYLMIQVSPTAAGACSYVNPIVAMLLGACYGEVVGVREFVALATVLAGVALVSTQELRRTAKRSVEHLRGPVEAPPAVELQEACI